MKYIIIFIVINFILIDSNLANNLKMVPEENWKFFTDQVMGGKSTGKIEFYSQNKKYLRMSGNVTTENNGGFIQFRHKIRNKISNNIKFLQIISRGNNKKYYIHLRTSGTLLPWQYYSKEFKVSNKWERITINLSDFKRSGFFLRKKIKPSTIKSLAVVAFGKNHDALIEVSEISFLN
jgi:hypothetical protein